MIIWRHLHNVFTHIYSFQIDKNLCESQNQSIKFPCDLLDYLCFLLEASSFYQYDLPLLFLFCGVTSPYLFLNCSQVSFKHLMLAHKGLDGLQVLSVPLS